MEFGVKICQLRKLSGMTQEQLADKLSVTRQTLSKWENGSSMPDVESVVRLSVLFHTSLEELLLEEESHVEKGGTQITLEDMMRINAHNRRKNLFLCSGLLFLAASIMIAAFAWTLENTMASLEYILYRYMVTGGYQAPLADGAYSMLPAVLAGAIGICLCLCGLAGKTEKKKEREKE